jgi:hypothetical protein
MWVEELCVVVDGLSARFDDEWNLQNTIEQKKRIGHLFKASSNTISLHKDASVLVQRSRLRDEKLLSRCVAG